MVTPTPTVRPQSTHLPRRLQLHREDPVRPQHREHLRDVRGRDGEGRGISEVAGGVAEDAAVHRVVRLRLAALLLGPLHLVAQERSEAACGPNVPLVPVVGDDRRDRTGRRAAHR